MKEPKATGRPSVGTAINLVVQDWALTEAQEIGFATNQPRAEVLRQAIARGLTEIRKASKVDSTEFVQPAASVLAAWIGSPDDVKKRRERFLRWRKVAGHPLKGMNLLMEAAGTLTQDGQPVVVLPPPLIERLTAPDGWRARGQLFFTVMAVLGQNGVTVATGEAAEDLPEPDWADEDHA